MRPMEEKLPLIKFVDRQGKSTQLTVSYSDHIPDILNRFPDAVLRRAVNKTRTREEDHLLQTARSLPWAAREVVYRSVIYQRALKIEEQMRTTALKSISVRKFLQQQNARLSREAPGMTPTFSSASMRKQELTLTERMARDLGSEPYVPSHSSPSRDRGR